MEDAQQKAVCGNFPIPIADKTLAVIATKFIYASEVFDFVTENGDRLASIKNCGQVGESTTLLTTEPISPKSSMLLISLNLLMGMRSLMNNSVGGCVIFTGFQSQT